MEQITLPKLLRVPVVASALDVTVPRAREVIRIGDLKAVYVGRQIRVSEDELRRYIEQRGKRLAGGWKREPNQAA